MFRYLLFYAITYCFVSGQSIFFFMKNRCIEISNQEYISRSAESSCY